MAVAPSWPVMSINFAMESDIFSTILLIHLDILGAQRYIYMKVIKVMPTFEFLFFLPETLY